MEDRKLTHVNKKGRPVSQCPHCRGLRRARATHAKCDCGERPHNKEDCDSHEKSEPAGEFNDHANENSADSGASNMHICCCSHGARCVCALKKGPLDPVPEVDYNDACAISNFAPRMPRLVTAQSETALMVFANGHHKPAHKFNDAAHKSGLPYTIPIPHSVPGKSGTSREMGHRSTDSLPLLGSVEKASLQLRESISSAQQEVRLVRSEHGSPHSRILPQYEGYDSPIPALDISNLSYTGYISSPVHEDYPYHSPTGVETYFNTPHDELPPTLSAGLTSPVEAWSATDLPLGSSAYPRTYSQSASYNSFDHSNVGQPGLTTSSSGDVSEAGDYISHYPLKTEQASTTSSEIPMAAAYPANPGSPFMNHRVTSSVDRNFIGSGIKDVDTFLQTSTASPTELEEPNDRASFGSDIFSRHGLTVQDAQKLAHSSPPSDTVATLSLQTPLDDIDPSWASEYTPDEAPFGQEDNSSFV